MPLTDADIGLAPAPSQAPLVGAGGQRSARLSDADIGLSARLSDSDIGLEPEVSEAAPSAPPELKPYEPSLWQRLRTTGIGRAVLGPTSEERQFLRESGRGGSLGTVAGSESYGPGLVDYALNVPIGPGTAIGTGGKIVEMIPRAVKLGGAAYFTGRNILGAKDAAQTLYSQYQKQPEVQDPQAKRQAALDFAMNTAFAALGAKGFSDVYNEPPVSRFQPPPSRGAGITPEVVASPPAGPGEVRLLTEPRPEIGYGQELKQLPEYSQTTVEEQKAIAERIDPSKLRPAVKVGGKLLEGEPGETHADILIRNGRDPESIPHQDPRRGFINIDDPNQLISRVDAQRRSGLKGTADAGGLDSMDLPGAAKSKVLKEAGVSEQELAPPSTQEAETTPIQATTATGQPIEAEQLTERQLNAEKARDRIQSRIDEIEMDLANSGYELFQGDLYHEDGTPVNMDSLPSRYEDALMEHSGLHDELSLAEDELANANSERRKTDALRELRPNQVVGETPPGNLQKVGEEIRQGTEAPRETRVGPAQEQTQQSIESARQVAEKTAERKGGAPGKSPSTSGEENLIFSAGIPIPTWAQIRATGVAYGQAMKALKQAPAHMDMVQKISEQLGAAETKSRTGARQARNAMARRVPTIPPQGLDAFENNVNQRLLQAFNKQWLRKVSIFRAPEDGRPILTDPGLAPADYQLVEVRPYARASVHPRYAPLMRNLTRESGFRDSFLQKAIEFKHQTKHLMLVFDTFHMFRIMYREGMARGAVTVVSKRMPNRNHALIEYDRATLQDMVHAGELPPDFLTYYDQNKPSFDRLVNAGMNVGRISTEAYNDWVKKIPLFGGFNRWLFEKQQRSAMTAVGLNELKKLDKASPSTPEQNARMAAKSVNTIFGNLQRQSLIKNPEAKDVMDLLFLAPEWTESNISREAIGMKQLGEAAIKGKRPNLIGRTLGLGIVAAFIANQMINKHYRGKYTWENPEPARTFDAWIPDYIDNTDGFFISPMPEDYAQYKQYRREGLSPMETGRRMVGNKISGPARAAFTLKEGVDFGKRQLTDRETLEKAATELFPLPLPASKLGPIAVRKGLEAVGVESGRGPANPPGSMQRQLMSSVGIKVEPAGRKEKLDTMTLKERAEKYKSDVAKRPKTYEGKERGAAVASTENIRRGKEIENELPASDRRWLKEHDLLAKGYRNTVRYNDKGTMVELPLSDKESARYKEIQVEEFKKVLPEIEKRFDRIHSSRAQGEFYSDQVEIAHNRARQRMEDEVKKSSSTVELDRKKYKTPGLGK